MSKGPGVRRPGGDGSHAQYSQLLASVRLSAPIPKKDIFRAMEEIRRVSRKAPVHIGDVVISHLLGTDADVIVTKNVNAAHAAENL